jgi:regulator of RNase E activity RraA
MSGMKRALPVLVVVSVAILLGTASTARADYGSRAAYQVEISSNPPGFGFWIWAELDQDMAGGDYQETDCIHLGGGHVVSGQVRDAAAHDSGDVSGWSIDWTARTLTMHGVNIIGNAEVVDVTVPLPASGQYGHVSSMTLTWVGGAPIIAGTFPAQVQLAP